MTTDQSVPQPGRRTNPLAIAALVCGIVQLSGLFPAGVAAIILGHKALRRIRQSGEDGYGLAKTGLVLGYLGLVLMVLGFLLALGLSQGPVMVTGPHG